MKVIAHQAIMGAPFLSIKDMTSGAQKIQGEPKKSLANLWSRPSITIQVHAGRGLENVNQYE
jgi:hypothetical protein